MADAIEPCAIVCVIALLILFCLNFSGLDCPTVIGLVPVNTFIANRFVWNLVTASFFENNFVKLGIDIIGFYTAVSKAAIDDIEQFMLYFFLTLLATTLGTSAYCFIRFFATRLEEMITESIFGFNGTLICWLTYSRQQLKNTPLISSIPFITYNNISVLIIFFQVIFWVLGLKELALDLPFSIISLLFSWSYMRIFYRYKAQNGGSGNCSNMVGDKSEDFAFVNMFPSALHVIVVPFTTAFYNLFVVVGVFPEVEQAERKLLPHHLRYSESSSSRTAADGGVALASDAIQERRRAKAMRLLDAKIAALSKQSDGWDDKDDGCNIEAVQAKARPV